MIAQLMAAGFHCKWLLVNIVVFDHKYATVVCVCGEPTTEGGGIQMIGELFIKDHPTNCIYICGGGRGSV